MSQLNFAIVKMAHHTWRIKLRNFLDGNTQIVPKDVVSHQDCELGKWLYSEALTRFGQLHDMQELEKKHRSMHAVVRHVVELKHAGKIKEAQQRMATVYQEADAVVALLTKLEQEIA